MIEESLRQGAERAKREVHHGVPRCLLRLRDQADDHTELDGEGLQLWLDYESMTAPGPAKTSRNVPANSAARRLNRQAGSCPPVASYPPACQQASATGARWGRAASS